MNFVENNNVNKSKPKRKLKIILFNPLFKCKQTNIGKITLQLLSNHFPKNHNMHKICDKNTVKLSYGFTKSIGLMISGQLENLKSNCSIWWMQRKSEKWMSPQWWSPYTKIIYRADVSNDGNIDKNFYLGLADTPFKRKYRSHIRSFKHQKYKNSTVFTKYIWQLKLSNNVSIKCLISTKLWIITFINDKNLD